MTDFISLMNYDPTSSKRTMMTSRFDETDGTTIYELCAFSKKEVKQITEFFLPSNMQYQDMLRNIVADNLMDINAIYRSYDKLYKACGGVLNKFLFANNVHNFVCFLQQFKGELESLNIVSCIPARKTKAKAVDYVKAASNGVVIDIRKGVCTNKITRRRTSQVDPIAKYKWFMDSVTTSKHDINDSTIVIRTMFGDGPIKFYNCSENSVKHYEMDYLKSIYAKETNVNYLDVRPISFKTWKNLPLEKKVGTRVTQLSVENTMRYTKLFDSVISNLAE